MLNSKQEYSDDPLTLTELSRYSTWFAMHPEKVAGKEEVTTSLHFPITIKGSKDDIVKTIEKGIEIVQEPLAQMELEAMALETELELMNFTGSN